MTEQVSREHRQQFYELGGNELLSGTLSENELPAKISQYQRRFNEIQAVTAQLHEASNMALVAMDNSSDMGSILGFIKDSINEREYHALAQSIFKYVHAFSRAAAVEIVGAGELHYYYTDNTLNEELHHLLNHNKVGNRIVQYGDLLQINREHFTVSLVGLPEDNEERLGVIRDNMAIFADIAERFVVSLALEEELHSAEKAKQAFLDTLGHELKTPLNAIVGLSKLMLKKDQNKPLGSNGAKAIDNIYQSSQRLNLIISNLLDISHVSNNQKDLITEPFSIREKIDNIVKKMKPKLASNSNELNLTCPSNLTLYSDPLLVEHMLFQLIDNAVKFTKGGQIKITIVFHKGDPNDWIYAEIEDTGCGIDPTLQSKLFDNVGQLDQSHDRQHYGLGIGLYYVNVISRFLGGGISFSSKVDVGSKFILHLPSIKHKPKEPEPEPPFDDGGCELF